jgi:hypothetical protein
VIPEAQALTDEWVYRLANRSFYLQSTVHYALLGDPAIREKFSGTGFASACAALMTVEPAVVASYEPAFKPLAIAAMREKVPAEVMRAARGPGIEMENPLLIYRSRVRDALAFTAAELYRDAETELRRQFAEQLEVSRRRTDLPVYSPQHPWAGETPGGVALNCSTYAYAAENRAVIFGKSNQLEQADALDP